MNADHLLPPLPSPTDRPGTSIIIYDGECRFCRRQVERLARWDRRQALSFLSLHDAEVRERFPEISHEDFMKHLYLIDADGTSYVGAEAFVVLSRRIPRLWLLCPVLNIPGTVPIWQWCYQQIARRRYALGKDACNDGSCDIHFGSH